MDIAPVLGELGTTVAVLAVFGWILWRLLGPFIERLMDNLDRQAASYERYAADQVKATMTLESLCQRLDEIEEQHLGRGEARDRSQAELREAQKEIVGALRGLQQQFQAHEGRAQKRSEQQLEESRQIVKALKALNGKS